MMVHGFPEERGVPVWRGLRPMGWDAQEGKHTPLITDSSEQTMRPVHCEDSRVKRWTSRSNRHE